MLALRHFVSVTVHVIKTYITTIKLSEAFYAIGTEFLNYDVYFYILR